MCLSHFIITDTKKIDHGIDIIEQLVEDLFQQLLKTNHKF